MTGEGLGALRNPRPRRGPRRRPPPSASRLESERRAARMHVSEERERCPASGRSWPAAAGRADGLLAPIYLFTLGVFSKAMAAELGWSRARDVGQLLQWPGSSPSRWSRPVAGALLDPHRQHRFAVILVAAIGLPVALAAFGAVRLLPRLCRPGLRHGRARQLLQPAERAVGSCPNGSTPISASASPSPRSASASAARDADGCSALLEAAFGLARRLSGSRRARRRGRHRQRAAADPRPGEPAGLAQGARGRRPRLRRGGARRRLLAPGGRLHRDPRDLLGHHLAARPDPRGPRHGPGREQRRRLLAHRPSW